MYESRYVESELRSCPDHRSHTCFKTLSGPMSGGLGPRDRLWGGPHSLARSRMWTGGLAERLFGSGCMLFGRCEVENCENEHEVRTNLRLGRVRSKVLDVDAELPRAAVTIFRRDHKARPGAAGPVPRPTPAALRLSQESASAPDVVRAAQDLAVCSLPGYRAASAHSLRSVRRR